MNNIQNINFMRSLTNLSAVYLRYNNISFMEPLRNLTNLEVLDLYCNELFNVNEIQIFTNFKKLRNLNIVANPIDKEITVEQLRWVFPIVPEVLDCNILRKAVVNCEMPLYSPFEHEL